MEPAGLIISFFVTYTSALSAIDLLIELFLLLFTIWWILAIPWRLWIIKQLLEEQLKEMKQLASHESPKFSKVIDDNQQEDKRIKEINQSNEPKEQLKELKQLVSQESPKSSKIIDDNQQEDKRIKEINQSNKPTDHSSKNVHRDKLIDVMIGIMLFLCLLILIIGFLCTNNK